MNTLSKLVIYQVNDTRTYLSNEILSGKVTDQLSFYSTKCFVLPQYITAVVFIKNYESNSSNIFILHSYIL